MENVLKSIADRLANLESEVAGMYDDRGGCDLLWNEIADLRAEIGALEDRVGDLESQIDE